jgi:hypothetical protein
MRCSWENGRERADAFELEDTTGLNGRFVDGGDRESMAAIGSLGIGEEVLRRGEVECGGRGDQADERSRFEMHVGVS